MTLKPSQLVKSEEMDNAFDELYLKTEQLENDRVRLLTILTKLVELKEYKEKNGKDNYYLNTRKQLWMDAKNTRDELSL